MEIFTKDAQKEFIKKCIRDKNHVDFYKNGSRA